MKRWRRFGLAGILVVAVVSGCGGRGFKGLSVGECLPETAKVVGLREADPPRVPCSQAHRYEVYAVARIDGNEAFPGQAVVDARAQQLCYDGFVAGVGLEPADLPDGVLVVTLGPNKEGWAERSVECLVQLPNNTTEKFIRPGAAGSSGPSGGSGPSGSTPGVAAS